MTDELKKLKIYIESTMKNERNHIFKYTSPLTRPQSADAKSVFLEYDRATSKERFHNYNLQSWAYGDFDVEEKHIPSFYDFLSRKLTYQFDKKRKSYESDRIVDSFKIYDEDESVEETTIQDFEIMGETDSDIFSLWLLFDHLFEIEEQIAKNIETKNFIGLQSHLDLIDDNFGFLMDRKDSYFKLKMNEDELYGWLLAEILYFKHQVEEKGLRRSLYKEPEKHFQWLFSAALGRVSVLFDVCMLAEPDVGSGKVDFIFSQGSKSKVCVELKLSTSAKVLEGYTKQLQQYLKSEKTDKGIYVVIDSGDSKSSYRNLLSFIEDGKKRGQSYPNIIMIDASKKVSASQQ
ncbi:hypothetical protein BZG14_15280 [Salinivibrio sp. IB282]|nr:hypothetical protein BZG14_15280 [Salinivibrio sp. IB282]